MEDKREKNEKKKVNRNTEEGREITLTKLINDSDD